MTEEEYHRIVRREKIFYAVLIIAWCFAFAVWFTIGFPKAKWVLIGGGTLIYLYSEKHLHRTSLVEAAGQTGSRTGGSAGRNWDRGRVSSCFGNGKKRIYSAGGTLPDGRNAEEVGTLFWNAERLFRCGAGLGIWQHASLCDGIHGRESYFFSDGA